MRKSECCLKYLIELFFQLTHITVKFGEAPFSGQIENSEILEIFFRDF